MLPSPLVERYHGDPESVYNTWFLDQDRLKAFRTIRRGIQVVVDDIEAGTFMNDYRGSSLEQVVEAVAEQKQVFAGAAHPFYWKPKLRIPDIYESRENQRRYAAFLRTALRTSDPQAIMAEIIKLTTPLIKGLGPASGNLLYFLHPTQFPPFNTAILRGYNLLTGQSLKLGDWSAYLQMRSGLIEMSNSAKVSKDLGDLAGLCFEIGSGRMVCPELPREAMAELATKWEKEAAKRHKEVTAEVAQEREHAEQQALLATLGRAWGYQVWIARNDHARTWSGGVLGALSVTALPELGLSPDTRGTVELIDVLWLDSQNNSVVAGFEVEKSTSIYSGILRLFDLAVSLPACREHLYLVAPGAREKEILMQLARPSLGMDQTLKPEYILFDDLACNCSQMARFGTGLPTLKKLSRKAQ